MPKTVIAQVETNAVSVTRVDLTDNAVFQGKAMEYCVSLSQALANNTVVKDLVLVKCGITDPCVIALSTMLTTNNTLETLNLEGNNISNDGAIALANALQKNTSLTSLVLLNQKKKAFGESCLEAWTECLTNNIDILQIQWNLDSRKGFVLSKFFSRNKEIERRRKTGMSIESLLPTALRTGQAAPEKKEAVEAATASAEITEPLVSTAVEEPSVPTAAVEEEKPSAPTPTAGAEKQEPSASTAEAEREGPSAPTEEPVPAEEAEPKSADVKAAEA